MWIRYYCLSIFLTNSRISSSLRIPLVASGLDRLATAEADANDSISSSDQPRYIPSSAPAQKASPAPVVPCIKPSGSLYDDTTVLPVLDRHTDTLGVCMITLSFTP